jgi:uncharacterized protein YbjT (DUF2867 family)
LYLTNSLSISITRNEIIEIGGPEAMSYRDFILKYAAWRGRRLIIIRLPWLPETVAAWWLDLFTPRGYARVGKAMVDSFRNEMVVTNNRAQELYPDIKPRPIEEFFS